MDFKIGELVTFSGLQAKIIEIKWHMIRLNFIESKDNKWVSTDQLIKENNG